MRKKTQHTHTQYTHEQAHKDCVSFTDDDAVICHWSHPVIFCRPHRSGIFRISLNTPCGVLVCALRAGGVGMLGSEWYTFRLWLSSSKMHKKMWRRRRRRQQQRSSVPWYAMGVKTTATITTPTRKYVCININSFCFGSYEDVNCETKVEWNSTFQRDASALSVWLCVCDETILNTLFGDTTLLTPLHTTVNGD